MMLQRALWILLLLTNGFVVSSATVSAPSGHREGIERILNGNDHCLVFSTNVPPPWHTVAMPLRTNLPVIHWYDKINPVWWFGNADEPVAPAWYEPGHCCRNLMWNLRNPIENFSNYVIGVGDKPTERSGRYPTLVGNPHGGWNFAVTRYGILYLPFWDYKNRRMEFYFGWRERGNFGIKLVFHQKPEVIK